MEKIIWSKITETKEVCNIILSSMIVGRLIVDKDPINPTKWMCSFEGFPYHQIFCFDNKYRERYGLHSKELAKNEVVNQLKKIIDTLYMFSSQMFKTYRA